MDKNTEEKSCMSCSCQYEMHKEHNHPGKGEHKDEARVCHTCGHEHKADGSSCDCGCK